MSTKVVRVEEDCVDIIRKWSPMGSLTDGIRLMNKMLTEKEIKLLEQKVTNAVGLPPSNFIVPGGDYTGGMSPEYWKNLEKIVDKVVVQYAGR
jgi:hypothetical protein